MATKKTNPKTTKSKKKITVEDIRLKALDIYGKRMQTGTSGDAQSDWIQAEKELLNSK